MSPVGHSLVGATLAATLFQENQIARERGKILAVMVVAANIPDLPFPYWGHSRYEISHSLFTGSAIVIVYCLLARLTSWKERFVGSWRFIAIATVALYSHYFLDTLYNRGRGLATFWPLFEARVALPLPWLAHMQLDPLWSGHNLRVWSVELLKFGIISA